MYVIHLDVIHTQVAVFPTFEEYNDYFDKETDFEPVDANTTNACASVTLGSGGAKYFSMVIPDGTGVGTIAHESLHIVDYLCDELGIPITVENTEIRGYMIGYIVDCIVKGEK